MAIASLSRTIPIRDRFMHIRSTVGKTAASSSPRARPESAVNEGRWAMLPGEYAGRWSAAMQRTLSPITVPGITAAIPCLPSYGSLIVHLAGRWAGRVLFEGSADGIAWFPLALAGFESGAEATEATRPSVWRVLPQADFRLLRFRVPSISAGTIHLCVAAMNAVPQIERRCFDPAA